MRYLLLILLIPFVSAEIIINEIMYNPSKEQGEDRDLEWIEIFSDEEINLGDYYLYDEKLESLVVKDYFIVARNKTAFRDYYNLTAIESKFILSNKGGYINFTNLNQSYVISYSNRFANGNGKSLEFKEGQFYESLDVGGSPGMKNSIEDVRAYDLEIFEFMADPEEGGEWIEIYSSEDADLTGYYLSDSSNRTLYLTDVSGGTKIETYLVVNFHNSKLLNNDGDEIRLINPLNEVVDKVSYFTSKKGFSWSKIDEDWFLTEPSPGKENYKQGLIRESFLSFDKINKTEFGSLINVEVNIYKGDTNKKSVYLYVENLTKRTKVNVDRKFNNYSLNLPLFIDPNCNGKFMNKSYNITLTGLDAEYTNSIEIEGINPNICRTDILKSIECDNLNEITETNLNEEEVIYESKNIKAERAALLFFCSLLVLIIAIQLKNGR